MFSHVADADQYCVLGGGEGKAIITMPDFARQPKRPIAISDYNILDTDF